MKGIIFDFNGTMFFDNFLQEKTWRTYWKEKLNREVTDEEFQYHIHGRNAQETFSYFFNRPIDAQQSARLGAEVDQLYRRLCLEAGSSFCLAPGLTRFLEEVKEKQLPCTIATASSRGNVEFFFQHLGLAQWFDLDKVVFNDGSIPGKPAPDIFLKAAQVLHLAPQECVIFEDAISGLQAARRAGAGKVVAIASTVSLDELKSLADVIYPDYCSLHAETCMQW